MRVRIARTELVAIFALSSCASIFLIWATAETTQFWRTFYGGWADASFSTRLLTYMDVSREDVVGSWFSSMLLALVAWLAVLCFLADVRAGRKDKLRFGWLVMAVGFVALSFDELGSIHERLSLPQGWQGMFLWYGPPMVLLPGYMVLFGRSRMRDDPVSAGMALLGSVCFATIPVQEYFETEVRGAMDGVRPVIEIVLEEGTELVGMLLFLAAFMRYFVRTAGLSKRGSAVLFSLPRDTFVVLWTAVFIFGFASREVASSLLVPDELSGNCRNWFPAFAAFLTACLVWHSRPSDRLPIAVLYGMTAAGSLALSMIAGVVSGPGERLLSISGLEADGARSLLAIVMFAVGGALAAVRFETGNIPVSGYSVSNPPDQSSAIVESSNSSAVSSAATRTPSRPMAP